MFEPIGLPSFITRDVRSDPALAGSPSGTGYEEAQPRRVTIHDTPDESICRDAANSSPPSLDRAAHRRLRE
jgi:hypothetical protein